MIIPTYNRPSLVGRAIKSVLGQSYQDFELIVVDGSSDDETKEVVKGFGDRRIRYVSETGRRGLSNARNMGIRSSMGDYVALLDDDDEWLPYKLEMQVDLLDRLTEDYGVVYSGYRTEQDGRIAGEYYPAERGYVYARMLKGSILSVPTIIIRRSCFEVVGYFDEELPSCEDWDMWIRLAKEYKFEYVPEILAVYHIHGDQMTFDQSGLILGVAEGTRFMFRSMKLNPIQNGIVHVLAALITPDIYREKMLVALTGVQNAKLRQNLNA